jgi:hypothetical protein
MCYFSTFCRWSWAAEENVLNAVLPPVGARVPAHAARVSEINKTGATAMMKKTIVIMTLALVLCVLFAVPALAADSSNFDTAIQIPQPMPRGESVAVPATFEYYGQEIYYVFTAAETGIHRLYRNNTAVSIRLYNSDFNIIAEYTDEVRLVADETYYVQITSTFRGGERTFLRDAKRDVSFTIVSDPGGVTFNETMYLIRNYWWTIFIVIGYVFLMNFVYRIWVYSRYEYDPMGGVFKGSFVVSGIILVLGMFDVAGLGTAGWWVLAIPGAVAMVIISIQLFVKTKNIALVILNLVLLSVFYAAFVIAWFILIALIVMQFMLAGMEKNMKSKHVGSGGERVCQSCGKPLGTALDCSGCGANNRG